MALTKHKVGLRCLLAAGMLGLFLVLFGPYVVPTRKVVRPGTYELKPISNSCLAVLLVGAGEESRQGPEGTILLQVLPHAANEPIVTLRMRPDRSFSTEGAGSALTGRPKLDEEALAQVCRSTRLKPEEIAELASTLFAIGDGVSADQATCRLKNFRRQPMWVKDDRYLAWIGGLGYLMLAGSLIAGALWVARRRRAGTSAGEPVRRQDHG